MILFFAQYIVLYHVIMSNQYIVYVFFMYIPMYIFHVFYMHKNPPAAKNSQQGDSQYLVLFFKPSPLQLDR